MNCVACGHSLSPGNRFCPGCGAPVNAAVAATEPVVGGPPEAQGSATSDVPAGTAAVWKFRDSISKFADKVVASMTGGTAAQNPFLGALSRFIQGALMHRDIYLTAARQKNLTMEACWIAGAIILAEAIGATWVFRGLMGTAQVEWIAMAAGIRLVSLACGVFALQFFAKAIHHTDLHPLAWFRAVVYAQAATILAILGSPGMLAWLWAAACIIAAIRDLTQKSITDAVILLIIVWVPYSIAAALMAKALAPYAIR